MPKRSLIREIIDGDDLRGKVQRGVDAIYQVALASYGAGSGNVMIEHRYGEPLISHDGITNVGKLIVEDSVENSAVSVIRQASEKTNRDAGDSTTLTIVLAKLAYDYWLAQGLTPRQTQAAMDDYARRIVEQIRAQAQPIDEDRLHQVSRISAGDDAIGAMVADAVSQAGELGAVTVIEQAESIISSEVVDGFTFKKGLKAVALANDIQALKSRYEQPAVIVMPKLISKNDEILPILDKALIAGHSGIILVADVSGQALEAIIGNKLNGKLDIAIVEPPVDDRDAFLSDLAAYASTKVFSGSEDDFEVATHVGTVDSAYITLSETTLNGCQSKEALEQYVETISEKSRRERINGKTVRIAVGAPTQAERQELRLRIEDAVCAAQTATEYGVLPGGGVFLRDFDPNGYIAQPFEILTGEKAKEFDLGVGVNIETGERVNVFENGVIDSAKAIEEAVINSHSVAAQLISVRMALPYIEDME